MAVRWVNLVELSISRSNLLNKDVGSKSDPLCVMMQSIGNDKLDRTERVKICQDPEFSKKLLLDYHFERVQKLKLGCTLGQIVSSKKLTRPLQMKKGKPAGKGIITITAEEIKDNRDIVLELEAKGLDKKDLFGKSYPFLEFFKQEDDGKWQLVHRTEVLITIFVCLKYLMATVDWVCRKKWGCRIQVYGMRKCNWSDFVSSCHLTVHPEKKKKSSKNSGVISVKCCQVGFLYFSKVGFDFTGSNGDPRSPQSLHYLSPDVLNQYLAAIWSVGLVQYFVLLIITDGEITDPGPDPGRYRQGLTPEALAQSVLAEVPSQLVSYFKMLKLDPVNVAAIKT
uniref:C2 domain-containing protein n=1 Tax=Oncorhynchus tshawytscha TaxID=74940 RepID=A0A8C8GVX0_ONCTS